MEGEATGCVSVGVDFAVCLRFLAGILRMGDGSEGR